MATVLIVEDEAAIADLIELHIKLAGHLPLVISDGLGLDEILRDKRPDIIILDVMLPGRDGFSLMSDIQPLGIPVIFLTAKDRLEDKIAGLKLGADDYIIKPFEAIELTTRVDAVLRRCGGGRESFMIGNLEVRADERTVLTGGAEAPLTAKEFDLLQVLIQNKNLALSREKLLEMVWGYDYMGETRTVDVHIQRLRKKLRCDDVIKTVYKYGYRLDVPR